MTNEYPWTPAAVEALTRLWLQRDPQLSTNEIARRLRTSKNSVVGKCDRLNLPARPNPVKKYREAGAPSAGRVGRAGKGPARTMDPDDWAESVGRRLVPSLADVLRESATLRELEAGRAG